MKREITDEGKEMIGMLLRNIRNNFKHQLRDSQSKQTFASKYIKSMHHIGFGLKILENADNK